MPSSSQPIVRRSRFQAVRPWRTRWTRVIPRRCRSHEPAVPRHRTRVRPAGSRERTALVTPVDHTHPAQPARRQLAPRRATSDAEPSDVPIGAVDTAELSSSCGAHVRCPEDGVAASAVRRQVPRSCETRRVGLPDAPGTSTEDSRTSGLVRSVGPPAAGDHGGIHQPALPRAGPFGRKHSPEDVVGV